MSPADRRGDSMGPAPSVVLVESDAVARARYEAALRGGGFRVAAAGTREAAQSLLSDDRPALLIANVLLDDGSAIEWLAGWKRAGRPLVTITDAYQGPTSRQILSLEIDTAAFIEAPADDDDLLELVRAVWSPGPEADTDAERGLLTTSESELGGDTDETPLRFVRPAPLDPARVPLNGTFDDADVAAVLARLALEGADGALMLQGDKLKKLVYFEAGVPVGIKSNRLQECLGQILVQEGRLDQEACEASLDEMRRTNQRQGEVLVAAGHLQPDELAEAVSRQFWLKFNQLFTWTSGAYRFKDTAIPAGYRSPPLDAPANLIWRALDQVRPADRVRARMTPVLPLLVEWCGDGLDVSTLPIDADVHQLFEELDGRKTAADALAATPDPEGAELLLYALTAFGAVTYVTAAPD